MALALSERLPLPPQVFGDPLPTILLNLNPNPDQWHHHPFSRRCARIMGLLAEQTTPLNPACACLLRGRASYPGGGMENKYILH